MNNEFSSADFIALVAIAATIISGSINFSQMGKIDELKQTITQQKTQIETIERTLMMSH